MKRFLKISLWVVSGLAGLLLLCFFIAVLLIRSPSIQTKLVHWASRKLSEKLKTEVKVGSVDIRFFKTIMINDVLVLDQKQDTIISIGKFQADIRLLDLFDKNIGLKSLSLDTVTVQMVRKQGEKKFNYTFIIDAFSSGDTTSSKSSKLKLNLDQLTLNKIRFHFMDGTLDMHILLPHFSADINKMDITKARFDVKDAILSSPFVQIHSLHSTVPADTSKAADTSFVHLNTKSFGVTAKGVAMRDAHFIFDDDDVKPDSTSFDPGHMNFSHINIIAENAAFVGDSIKGKLVHFSVKEKSGMEVDTLKGNVLVTPKKSVVSNMTLRTARSRITDYFDFTYYNFPSFNNFTTEVKMHINSNQSDIDLRDISCFSSFFDNFTNPFRITGNLKGTVADIEGKNVEITTAGLTTVKADLSIIGLPDVDEAYFDISAYNARTNYNDAASFYKGFDIPEQLKQAGTISFNGNFTGFISDFVAYGAFQSDLGLLESDLNMKHVNLPDGATYSGQLSSNGFNLGKFIKQDSLLGRMVFTARVSGKGLTAKSVDASIISNFSRFDFNNYSYSDIDINGLVQGKLFTGKLNINDPNVNLDFQGTVDFNNPTPVYKFYAKLDSVNLKPLHLSKKDYNFSSVLQLNMSGNTLNNILGNAYVNDIKFRLGDKQLLIDSLTVKIKPVGKNRNISIVSDFLDANIEGNIDLAALYPSILTSVADYFPSIPVKFEKTSAVEAFTYSVQTHRLDKLTGFFFPTIKGFSQSKINGSYSTDASNITMQGVIPYISYSSYTFRNITLKSSTLPGKLILSLGMDTLIIGDSIYVNQPNLSALVSNNVADFELTGTDKGHLTKVDIMSKLVGGNDSVKLHFAATTFNIEGHSWTIDSSNAVVYGNNYLRIHDLRMNSDNQSISIQTGRMEDGALTVAFKFSNVDIAEFYRYIRIGNYDASGILNGDGVLINPLGTIRFNGSFSISQFVFNNDSIREITGKADYDINKDEIGISLKASGGKYDFEANGSYTPSATDNQLNVTIAVKKFELGLLDKYLRDYVSSVEGHVTEGSTLNLSGTVTKPVLTGKVGITDGRARINYLQVEYTFSTAEINFKDGVIDIGEITLTDKFNNKAIFGGEIFHNHLKNFDLNLYINTKLFCFLNTTQKDNDLYFGTAFASGIVNFKGPLARLEIDANIVSRHGTVISIPISDQYSVGDNQTIRFINTSNAGSSKQIQYTNNDYLTLNLDMELTPDATVKIIFNQKSGDIITGQGNGNLRLEIKTNGDFKMYGDYTITSGSYNFTIPTLVTNKRFIIDNGGTISWTGDPYQARINIEAIYVVPRCVISDLGIAISQTDMSAYTPIEVDVYMNLTGSLLQPNVAFDIKLPINSSAGFSSVANRAISDIKSDPDELNKQVFGLLIANRFLPTATSNINLGSVANSGVDKTVSEYLSNQISYWASQNKYNVGLNLNYNSYSANLDPTLAQAQAVQRRELMVGMEKSFFNARLKVSAGGDFDVTGLTGGGAVAGPANANNHVAADVDVQYKLTPDGRFTLDAYNKGQYDVILNTNENQRGVSIAYKKEFNTLKELFAKRKKKPVPPPSSTPPAATPPQTVK